LFFICFPILLVALSYSYKNIDTVSKSYKEANKVFNVAKNKNTLALKEVKKHARGSVVSQKYNDAYIHKKEAFMKLNKEIESQKVFGFDSMHYFWERFGRNSVDILFAVFILFLIIKFIPQSKNKIIYWGSLLTSFAYLSTKFFILFWIFKQFQDFSLAAYIFVTFISSFSVVSVMLTLMKYIKTEETSLKSNLLDLAKFSFQNTKPEKREEMLDLIKEIAKNK